MLKLWVGDFMRCPNCHGEIEDNLATCSMCNYILDYDKVNLDKDLDKISKTMFIIQQNLRFLIKLSILLFLIGFNGCLIYMIMNNPFMDKTNLVIPILGILICVFLIIIIIRGKRKWR